MRFFSERSWQVFRITGAGFTFVEVMISTVIFSFLLLGLYGIMQTCTAAYSVDSAFVQLQQNTRNGLTQILREVRESKVSAVSIIDEKRDKIFFSTPSKNHIMFYLEEHFLIREYSGRTRVIATDIDRLKFIKTGSQLSIDIGAGKMVKQRYLTFNLFETVKLRNE